MKKALGIAALFVALAALGMAAPVDTPGLVIIVDDKVFSDFTCTIAGPVGTAGPELCSQINVVGQSGGPFMQGLEFTGGFFALYNPPPEISTVDVLIGYNVTSLAGPTIVDLHLAFNGNASSPVAAVEITETAFIGGTLTPVAQLFVQDTNPALPSNTLSDSAVFAPQESLDVQKDILLLATAPGGFVTFSFVDQFVSQVPEPASIFLLGGALVGTIGLVRRRRARA